MKRVVITEIDSSYSDEMFATWYKCPICMEDDILPYFKYCPHCGVPLDTSGLKENKKCSE